MNHKIEVEMLVDSEGNEYRVGAIVRMYHFTGSRKRKNYMYKQVIEVNDEKERIGFCHLPIKMGEVPKLSFSCGKDEVDETTVIVQNYYDDHRCLKRSKRFRD